MAQEPQADPWTENEVGPDCSCGGPRVVKLMPDGKAVLLCLTHTREAGAIFRLPERRPAHWAQMIGENKP